MKLYLASIALAALVAYGGDSASADVTLKETDARTTHPNMYLNATEIAKIKSRVNAGVSP